MSLLLDALKKAAQQKAKKSGKTAESTEIVDNNNTQAVNQQGDTALNDTIALDTSYEETIAMDATAIDQTAINEETVNTVLTDDTILDHEPTQLDETSITDSVSFNTDVTQLDQDASYEETLEMDASAIHQSAIFGETEDTVLTKSTLLDQDAIVLDDTSFTEGVTFASDTTHFEDTQFAESTEKDATAIDQTAINGETEDTVLTDSTLLDQDATQLDETSITDSVSFNTDATQLDQDASYEETLEMDASAIHQSAIFGETEDTVLTKSTLLDQDTTVLDDTSFTEGVTFATDTTHFEDTQFAESTEKDTTAVNETVLDEESFDTALIDTIAFDSEPDAPGQHAQLVDTTDMNVTSADKTEIKDDTEMKYQSQLADEDRTLFIYDGAEQASTEADDNTPVAFSETEVIPHANVEHDEANLTEDDVTQFMGDGVPDRDSYAFNQQHASGLGSDDTTMTNPEALELTNFSFDDEPDETITGQHVPTQNQTQSDTFSLQDQDTPDQTYSADLAAGEVYEEVLTQSSTEATSTVSSIDIEQLTNDEMVTVGGKTTTKTFAPDNYDRTLLNLSDKDVSKIFPGMRPDSDTVMTPDYAKRIFLSKSGQVKARYYKIYAGIGLMLLLTVAIWGLFLLQQESELIDQRLVSLKRDPMPGVIKPQTEKPSPRLFESNTRQSNLKAADIISKAGDAELMNSGNLAGNVESTVETSQQQPPEELKDAQNEYVAGIIEDTVETIDGAQPPAQTQSSPAADNKATIVIEKEPAQAKASSTSTLSISSSRQVSQQNKLLVQAYESYEQGDMTAAKSLYHKVLALDESNRDGVLGMAAIHIQHAEYQQAIDKYQQLLVYNPKDSMAMAALISVANIDPQSGETQLKSMLREQPDTDYLHFALGNMYGSQNRWGEAQNAYFAALQNKPDDPNYAYNLAVSLEHIGKAATAVTFYRRALDNSSKALVEFDNQQVLQRLEVLAQ